MTFQNVLPGYSRVGHYEEAQPIVAIYKWQFFKEIASAEPHKEVDALGLVKMCTLTMTRCRNDKGAEVGDAAHYDAFAGVTPKLSTRLLRSHRSLASAKHSR